VSEKYKKEKLILNEELATFKEQLNKKENDHFEFKSENEKVLALFKEKNDQNEDRNEQLKIKLKTVSESHSKEIKSLNERIINMQSKHSTELQSLQENLDKKTGD